MSCNKQFVVLAILLVLLLFVSFSGACSCVELTWTPQDLCGRDFVLHGDVEGDRLIGNASTPERQTRIYTVKVKEILRGLERIKNISRSQNTSYVEIHTPPNNGPCGITLNLNESYVITGSIENQKMNSYLCSDWNTKWQEVPSSFKEFFPKLATCAANAINASGVLLLSILLTAFRMTER